MFIHHYQSTACLHANEDDELSLERVKELHTQCQTSSKRYDGTYKHAGHCKYCDAKCVCWCHQEPML